MTVAFDVAVCMLGGSCFPLFVAMCFPRRVYRGRFLTEPLARKFGILNVLVRITQIGFMLVSVTILSVLERHGHPAFFYGVVSFALYLDDYLTGDDDRWKRFKDAVRNKVKWRMRLPVFAPQRGTAQSITPA